MLDQTARMTAEGLEAEYCKVMEYIPAENRLLVRAGVGWERGLSVRQVSERILRPLLAMRCAPESPSFQTTSKTSNDSEPLNYLSNTGFAEQ